MGDNASEEPHGVGYHPIISSGKMKGSLPIKTTWRLAVVPMPLIVVAGVVDPRDVDTRKAIAIRKRLDEVEMEGLQS